MGLNNLKSKASDKADRKFEKKVEFYSKVRSQTLAATQATKTISKKGKARRRAKKLKAYDLSTLSEVLPELTEKKAEELAPFKLNNKSRQELVLKEGKHLAVVLNHQAFQSDPMGSIYQHLQSTQPVVEEDKPPKKRNVDGQKKKRKKKKGKKSASSGPQLMEM